MCARRGKIVAQVLTSTAVGSRKVFRARSPGDESEKLWTKCDNEKVSLDLDCGLDVDQYGL